MPFPKTRLHQPNSIFHSQDFLDLALHKKILCVFLWIIYRILNRFIKLVYLLRKNIFLLGKNSKFSHSFFKGFIKNEDEIYLQSKGNFTVFSFAGIIFNENGDCVYARGGGLYSFRISFLTTKRKVKISEKIWIIGDELPYNLAHFYHFFVYPYLYMRNKKIDFYPVFCFDLNKYQKDLLGLLGVQDYLELKGNPEFKIRSFITPKSYINGSSTDYFGLNPSLNKEMVNIARIELAKICQKQERIKVLLLRGAYGREVTNITQIMHFLILRGFQIIDPAKLSIIEQLNIFHNADVVVSSHGAALANSIVMNRHSLLIELKSAYVIHNNEFENLAAINSVTHQKILCDALGVADLDLLKNLLS